MYFTVEDPGFPKGRLPVILAIFPPKTAWNWKKIVPGARVSQAPLWSTTVTCNNKTFPKLGTCAMLSILFMRFRRFLDVGISGPTTDHHGVPCFHLISFFSIDYTVKQENSNPYFSLFLSQSKIDVPEVAALWREFLTSCGTHVKEEWAM